MKKISVLIIDDEIPACQRIEDLLRNQSDVQIMGICNDGYTAIHAISQSKPDLIFLDIQMPEINGFEVLEKLPPGQMPLVIFVTAFDQHALKAFDVHALDYLLKPFEDARFYEALKRAKTFLSQGASHDYEKIVALLKEHTTSNQNQFEDRICVRLGSRSHFLDTKEISFIKGAGVYVEIHSKGNTYLLRESLNHLESRLDPRLFCRIHRSYIVNFTKIRTMEHVLNGDFKVHLQDGSQLKMSRSFRNQLEACLGHKF